jgi:hypothetical protein
MSLELLQSLSPEHIRRLREHAFCFACLDNNPEVVDCYLPEAYNNLWFRSQLADIPNLYPVSPDELPEAFERPPHVFDCDPRDDLRVGDRMTEVRRAMLQEQIRLWNALYKVDEL